jgi:hypothetical protein
MDFNTSVVQFCSVSGYGQHHCTIFGVSPLVTFGAKRRAIHAGGSTPRLPHRVPSSRIKHKVLPIMALLALQLQFLFVFGNWYQEISALCRGAVSLDVMRIVFALGMQQHALKDGSDIRYIGLGDFIPRTASDNHLHNSHPHFQHQPPLSIITNNFR